MMGWDVVYGTQGVPPKHVQVLSAKRWNDECYGRGSGCGKSTPPGGKVPTPGAGNSVLGGITIPAGGNVPAFGKPADGAGSGKV